MGRGGAQHHGECQNVGKVDEDERKKGVIFFEVGLIARDHPQGPAEVEGPTHAQCAIENNIAMFGQLVEPCEESVDRNEGDRPKGKKYGESAMRMLLLFVAM